MRQLVFIVSLLVTFLATGQDKYSAFQNGEIFKFRIHYGMFTASYATLEVKEAECNDVPAYHVVGKGKSSGFLSIFFKVDDNYETYISKDEVKPCRFIRKINEGGHIKDIEINFDHDKKEAFVNNKKYETKKTFPIKEGTQDMMSAFYYLRNNVDVQNLQKGQDTSVNMFFDNENYPFKLRFLGREVIRTKQGKISCLIFRPLVQADRVFKEEESLTVWVSDDDNRLPVKIKADILVGSIEADLIEYHGLKHPVKFVD